MQICTHPQKVYSCILVFRVFIIYLCILDVEIRPHRAEGKYVDSYNPLRSVISNLKLSHHFLRSFNDPLISIDQTKMFSLELK